MSAEPSNSDHARAEAGMDDDMMPTAGDSPSASVSSPSHAAASPASGAWSSESSSGPILTPSSSPLSSPTAAVAAAAAASATAGPVTAHSFVSGAKRSSPSRRGFMIQDVWGWDDDTLESRHDYIQFLFPLCESSVFNDDAPVIDSTEIAELRADPQCRANMLRSFARMLSFYGFEQIEEAEEEQIAADVLVEDGNANFVERAQQPEHTVVEVPMSAAADGSVAETGSLSDFALVHVGSGDGHLQGIDGVSAISDSPDGEANVPTVAGKDAAPPFDASSSSPQKQHPKRHRQNTSTLSSTSSASASSSPPPAVSPAAASPSPQPPSESQQVPAQALPRPACAVRPSAHFKRRARASWAASFDHNHLRITRILKSLRIFGLRAHAQAFFDALMSAVRKFRIPVNERSRHFWAEANEYEPVAE